nr:DUF3991 and toprim domain-containing protein [Pleomorphomonas koreensis]
MEAREIEELKGRVECSVMLEKAGFAIDIGESTRRAIKFRRGDDIIIVIHDGKGWFDPLSDAKGDVLSLIRHLEGISFTGALALAADLVGFTPQEPRWARPLRSRENTMSLAERWWVRRPPWRGSATWNYLRDIRGISEQVLRVATDQNVLREGPHGSMWAAHVDDNGIVTGWEERGPDWRGFASGGAKILFRLGVLDGLRLVVTEAAIDAMSLASLEGFRKESLYLSTGGGWSPTTAASVRSLARRSGAQLVAATDANTQGEVFAARLREIADATGCDWLRLKPPAEDWNDALRARMASRKGREKAEGGKSAGVLPHVRRSRQG